MCLLSDRHIFRKLISMDFITQRVKKTAPIKRVAHKPHTHHWLCCSCSSVGIGCGKPLGRHSFFFCAFFLCHPVFEGVGKKKQHNLNSSSLNNTMFTAENTGSQAAFQPVSYGEMVLLL